MKISVKLNLLSCPLECLIVSMFRDFKVSANSIKDVDRKRKLLQLFAEVYSAIQILTNPKVLNERKEYFSDPIEALDAMSEAICLEDLFSSLAKLWLELTTNEDKIEIIVDSPTHIKDITEYLPKKWYSIMVVGE